MVILYSGRRFSVELQPIGLPLLLLGVSQCFRRTKSRLCESQPLSGSVVGDTDPPSRLVMGVANDWAPFSQNPLADGRKSTLHFCQVLHVKRVRPTHAGRIIPSAHCASHANQTGFHGLSEDAEKTMPTLQTCQIFRGMSGELIMMTGYFFCLFFFLCAVHQT